MTTSCDADSGCHWAEDGASTTNFWPYYYDAATGTAIDMESAGFEADAGGFEAMFFLTPS